jgi:hypothetical protein
VCVCGGGDILTEVLQSCKQPRVMGGIKGAEKGEEGVFVKGEGEEA